jgi:hypothetical protein
VPEALGFIGAWPAHSDQARYTHDQRDYEELAEPPGDPDEEPQDTEADEDDPADLFSFSRTLRPAFAD